MQNLGTLPRVYFIGETVNNVGGYSISRTINFALAQWNFLYTGPQNFVYITGAFGSCDYDLAADAGTFIQASGYMRLGGLSTGNDQSTRAAFSGGVTGIAYLSLGQWSDNVNIPLGSRLDAATITVAAQIAPGVAAGGINSLNWTYMLKISVYEGPVPVVFRA